MTGRFITFEGADGVGKSTQIARVAAALRERALEVVTTREPGGTPGAEAVRHLLLQGDADRWSARAETLLLAAARADHVERLIRPAVARGAWVLCDRFVDSTRAYQGGAGGVPDEAIMTIHRIATDDAMPDRTILLTLDEQAAAARIGLRGAADRMEGKGSRYRARLAAAFAVMAAADPTRFRVVDGAGDVDTVTDAILAAIDAP